MSNLNLAVQQGELVGLIGPNGSGKTTTINMLTGHLAQAGGHIFLRGQRADGRSPSEFAALRVGRTFQITQLFSRMTVLENMLVPGLARPHSHRAAATRTARRHLEFLGLAALETLQAKNLSGGQQKLLELGRALMLDPEILFLDEPFAGVNPFLRDQIIELVRRLHADGRTFVIVDHDIEALQRLVAAHGGDVARAKRSPTARWPRCARTRRCCGPMPVSDRHTRADRAQSGRGLSARHQHPQRHVGRRAARPGALRARARTAPANRRC